MLKVLSITARSCMAALMLFSTAQAAERWQSLPAVPAMPAATQSGMAPVNGIEMYYALYGEGEPVLLIHGGLGHGDIWGKQVAELQKTHQVIVADSRGHGRSTRNEEPFGYHLMASDYLALLDFLKIEKTALVGWSDGGIIGIDLALNHPERLTHLFAHAANVTTDGVDPAVATNSTFNTYIEQMGEAYTRMSKTPDEYDDFVSQISTMWETQPNWTADQLATITVPTAIVLGDHDEAITRAHTDYMASVIPDAQLIILENTSHFAMLQDPEAYNKAVLDFIAGN